MGKDKLDRCPNIREGVVFRVGDSGLYAWRAFADEQPSNGGCSVPAGIGNVGFFQTLKTTYEPFVFPGTAPTPPDDDDDCEHDGWNRSSAHCPDCGEEMSTLASKPSGIPLHGDRADLRMWKDDVDVLCEDATDEDYANLPTWREL